MSLFSIVLFLYSFSVYQSSRMINAANHNLVHISKLHKEIEEEYLLLRHKVDSINLILSKNLVQEIISLEAIYESSQWIDQLVLNLEQILKSSFNVGQFQSLEKRVRFLFDINSQSDNDEFNDDISLLENDLLKFIHEYQSNLYKHVGNLQKSPAVIAKKEVDDEINKIKSEFDFLIQITTTFFNQPKNYHREVRLLLTETDKNIAAIQGNKDLSEVLKHLDINKLKTIQKQAEFLTLQFYSIYEKIDFQTDTTISLMSQLSSIWSEYVLFLDSQEHEINKIIEKESLTASKDLQKKGNQFIIFLLIGAGIILFLIILFGLISYGRLNGLRKMAILIADGKENPNLIESSQSNDFVSQIIQAFNLMIESLDVREKEVQQYVNELSSYGKKLETDVKRRTQELSLKNEYLEQQILLRKQKEEKLLISNMALSNTSEAVVITNQNQQVIEVNPAYCEISGYSKDELLGKKPNCMNSDCQNKTFYKKMWQEINDKGCWNGEIISRRKSGESFHIWQTINAVTNDNGDVTNYVAVFRDITENKAIEKQLHNLAYNDHLTNLANRTLFYEYLEHELAVNKRNGKKIALLFIDLDGFKHVNDTYGHQVGDQLLIEISKVLASCIRDTDIAGRQGGDEFSILLRQLEDIEQAIKIASKIINKVSSRFTINEHSVEVGCSIGISISPDDSMDVDTLIKYSDTAMYYAKEKGKGRYEFFSEKLNKKNIRRTLILNQLNKAIADKSFEIHLQPQINSNEEIVAAESLIRWNDSVLGFVPPDEFIPIAEENGKIHLVDQIVLEKVCNAIEQFEDNELGLIPISINVSPKELVMPDFIVNLKNTLKQYEIRSDLINIEVTETAFMENIQLAKTILTDLKQLGFNLSLDDFGTGYSSLAYLHEIPFDHLKIDRSFIMNIPDDYSSVSITKTILSFAHSVGMSVVAEGVETRTQLDFLLKHECDFCQGYFISKPLPVNKFMDFIKQK